MAVNFSGGQVTAPNLNGVSQSLGNIGSLLDRFQRAEQDSINNARADRAEQASRDQQEILNARAAQNRLDRLDQQDVVNTNNEATLSIRQAAEERLNQQALREAQERRGQEILSGAVIGLQGTDAVIGNEVARNNAIEQSQAHGQALLEAYNAQEAAKAALVPTDVAPTAQLGYIPAQGGVPGSSIGGGYVDPNTGAPVQVTNSGSLMEDFYKATGQDYRVRGQVAPTVQIPNAEQDAAGRKLLSDATDKFDALVNSDASSDAKIPNLIKSVDAKGVTPEQKIDAILGLEHKDVSNLMKLEAVNAITKAETPSVEQQRVDIAKDAQDVNEKRLDTQIAQGYFKKNKITPPKGGGASYGAYATTDVDIDMIPKFNLLKKASGLSDKDFAQVVEQSDSDIPLFGAATDEAQLRNAYKAVGIPYPY